MNGTIKIMTRYGFLESNRDIWEFFARILGQTYLFREPCLEKQKDSSAWCVFSIEDPTHFIILLRWVNYDGKYQLSSVKLPEDFEYSTLELKLKEAKP